MSRPEPILNGAIPGPTPVAASGRRGLVRQIGLTLGRQVLTIIAGLGLSVLLARVLGPTGNGQYALAILLPTTLATLLNLGIAPANVYFVGRGAVSLRKALATTLRLWLLVTFVGLALSYGAIEWKGAVWFPGVPTKYLWLAIIVFPLTLLRDLLASLLQAIQDFDRYNRLLVAAPIATLLLAAVTVGWLRMGVVGGVLAYAIGSAAGLALAFRALSLRVAVSGDARRERYMLRCLGYGWKSHLSNILAFVNYRIDILLVNVVLSPAATGIYVIAVQIAERLWVLSQAVSAVLLPRLAALHGHEQERRQLTPLIARWVLVVSAAGAVVLALVAPLLVKVFFGNAYHGAVRAFMWLLPGVVLGGASRVVANDIAARGRPELNLYVALAVVVVNVIGNLLLVPRFGISGAAIATTIAYALSTAVRLGVYARLSGNRWFDPLVVPRHEWGLVTRAVSAMSLRNRG